MNRRQTLVLIALHLAVLAVFATWYLGRPSLAAPGSAATVPSATVPSTQTQPATGAPTVVGSALTDVAPAIPELAAATSELHGLLRGQPFWARLLAPDARFDGNRMLELVYSPPTPSELDGTVLVDCPFILLDASLRVVAWNGRDGLSKIERPAKSQAYKVTREVHAGDGDASAITPMVRTITIGAAWDLRLAPILLAFTWREATTGRARLVDFFGPRAKERLEIAWTPESLQIAGESHTPKAAPDGRLQRLTDAVGDEVLVVNGRK